MGRLVSSFQELAFTPFGDGVNALCWPRILPGDFAEVVALLRADENEGLLALDDAHLLALPLSPVGRVAVESMLGDLQLLRALDRDPVLNLIHGYPRDDGPGPVPTDVFSFHADSASIPADTWLCTYHGAASEGLRNEDAHRRVDVPETRAALLADSGFREDNEAFHDYLAENCYDLHYTAAAHARPYSFGLFNLWRIAVEYPGSPVTPCIHRAPSTVAGEPRLLMIC